MRMSWLRAAIVGTIAGAAVLGPVPATAAAVALNWEQEAPSASPPARVFAASAYDSLRNRMVVFGGSSNGAANLGDTWEWDGSTWTNPSPPVSPPVLAGAAMAYDSTRHVSVLFGGSTPTATSSDTWEWDGTTWTKRVLATSPPPMVWAAMAYDSTRGRMVVFGEFNPFGIAMPETWEYDGTNWTQASPANSPTPRQGAAMAFDSTRNKTVLFGGRDVNAGQRMADTWEWDGASWTQMTPSVSPYARFWHSMAYDPVSDRTILFGGDHIQPYSLGEENDTWEWDGSQWARDWTAAAPSVRAGQSMVYDSALGRMVLFGGFNAGVNPNTFDADTWELGPGIVTAAGNPQLTLNTTAGEFGSVDVGATSQPAIYSVLSSGTGPLVMTLSVSGDFSVSSSDCPAGPDPLAAGSSCLFLVTFGPTAPGDRFGQLTFTGNVPGGSLVIPLHGVGIGSDFAISVDRTSVGAYLGNPLPAVTVSTTAVGGTGTIALSSLTNDPGITASFSPSSVMAGGAATMTITAAPSLAPGTYGVRVVGTEGVATHYVDVTVQVLPIPDFTIAYDPSSATLAHGDLTRVDVLTTALVGPSPITLSVAVSPGGPTASVDSTISAGGLAIMTLNAGFSVAPGVYTVTVTGTNGFHTHSASLSLTVVPKGIVNGGFESGLIGWTGSGDVDFIAAPHTGTFAAQIGSASASSTSTLGQTFDVPASGGKLTFWYRSVCADKVKNDWFTATLLDGVTGDVSTVQTPVCVKNVVWTKVTVNLSAHAGSYVTITFVNHDDGDPATPSYTLVDDVALS